MTAERSAASGSTAVTTDAGGSAARRASLATAPAGTAGTAATVALGQSRPDSERPPSTASDGVRLGDAGAAAGGRGVLGVRGLGGWTDLRASARARRATGGAGSAVGGGAGTDATGGAGAAVTAAVSGVGAGAGAGAGAGGATAGAAIGAEGIGLETIGAGTAGGVEGRAGETSTEASARRRSDATARFQMPITKPA